MSIFIIMFLFLMLWLFFKFTWVMLKLCYVFCIGLPLALMLGMLGIVLCCTLVLAPVGTALMRAVGRVVYPF
ncbi:MAG: hypothetical protein LUF35_08365 [Lachnospiraceae bacterium]|nr:hypothetical protein [Lachnospiraceae bacterium]